MVDFSDLNAVTPEQRELLLDVGQFTLDIIGILEPTPFADITNGIVSLLRDDWLGAGISAVSVVPYAGDVAKLGKIPSYTAKVKRAIDIARRDARFEMLLRPILEKLLWALNRLPLERVPGGVRDGLEQMQRAIVDFLPGGGRAFNRLDRLADEMLRRLYGSTRNVGVLPRRNVRTAVEFFEKWDVAGGNLTAWANLLKGIDMHAIDPIRVTKLQPGELVVMYVDTGRHQSRQVGEWMVKAQGTVSSRNLARAEDLKVQRNLGLSDEGRVPRVYRVRETVEVLESKAASAADHWTIGGLKPHTAVMKDEHGRWIMKEALQVAGGGTQIFLPRAWIHLEELHPR